MYMSRGQRQKVKMALRVSHSPCPWQLQRKIQFLYRNKDYMYNLLWALGNVLLRRPPVTQKLLLGSNFFKGFFFISSFKNCLKLKQEKILRQNTFFFMYDKKHRHPKLTLPVCYKCKTFSWESGCRVTSNGWDLGIWEIKYWGLRTLNIIFHTYFSIK